MKTWWLGRQIPLEELEGSQRLSKDAIRLEMRTRRGAVSAEERSAASAAVCARLEERDVSGVVAVYLASPVELDLSAYVETLLRRGVPVVAPRWNGREYELARLSCPDGCMLRRGPMGILEPPESAAAVSPRDVSLWIVPGLAFTRDGRRLGYGGGWYDRLMAKASDGAVKLGVAYPFQIVDALPSDPHDIALTDVVTP